jgi:hypothetical protein
MPAEYLVESVGLDRANDAIRVEQRKVEALATVLIQNARVLHKQMHPILEGGMRTCKQVTCRRVREVLGQS